MQILTTLWTWFCVLNMLAPLAVGLWMWFFPETSEQREAARRAHQQRVREHLERLTNA